MASGYTIFVTYLLSGATTSGYSTAVHCNYIQKLYLDTEVPDMQEVKIYFTPSNNGFKFLNSSLGTGYSANKIYAVIQLVNNSGFTYASGVTPTAANWRLFNLTSQISGVGMYLTPINLTSQVFNIPLSQYAIMPTYNLNYLNYPISSRPDLLCFGDEVYFFGDVQTDIEAVVYTTDLSIPLPLNQFNSSTNNTWLRMTPKPRVFISEIGLYASVNGTLELVAIGKLNDPVPKDATISRTLIFDIDF
jgi:hypothetical protein